MTTEPTDQELVALALKSSEQFGPIIDRYEARLRRYVFRISNSSPEDVEDVLQEVFLKVYRNLGRYDPSLSFSSWIYRITHNQVISRYRRLKARPQTVSSEVTQDLLGAIASDLSPHADVERSEYVAALRGALGKLPMKYKEVLALRYFEELSYDEISDVLRKPVGTIGTLLNRAKKQLATILEKEGFEYE